MDVVTKNATAGVVPLQQPSMLGLRHSDRPATSCLFVFANSCNEGFLACHQGHPFVFRTLCIIFVGLDTGVVDVDVYSRVRNCDHNDVIRGRRAVNSRVMGETRSNMASSIGLWLPIESPRRPYPLTVGDEIRDIMKSPPAEALSILCTVYSPRLHSNISRSPRSARQVRIVGDDVLEVKTSAHNRQFAQARPSQVLCV